MKTKLTITYIKKGIEKTIKNGLQFQFKSGEIFYKILEGYRAVEYKIYDDIELIHIKNGKFIKETDFQSHRHNNSTMLILENCIFDCPKIKVMGMNVQLINCTFIEKSSNEIDLWDCQELDIKGIKNTSLSKIRLEDVKKVNLDSINITEKLKLINCDNVKIKNVNIQKDILIHCGTSLEIEDSKLNFENWIENVDAKNLSFKNSTMTVGEIKIYCENIKLENNSKIISNSTTEINQSNLKGITLDDTSYIQGSSIKIGEHEYKTEDNKPFILNKAILGNIWFQRKNLICTLKEIKKTFEQKIYKNLETQEQQELALLNKEEQQELEKIKESTNNEKEKVKAKIKKQKTIQLAQTKIKDI